MLHKTVVFLLLMGLFLFTSCDNKQSKPPEPHLELGQLVNFVGGDVEKTYIVVGYRQLLEDPTDKQWNDHAYVVISYTNNLGELKSGVVHRNAILKR